MAPSQLLSSAYRLHYDKHFAEACVSYHELLSQSPTPEEAAIAEQQLHNLRDFDGALSAADAARTDAAAGPPRPARGGKPQTASGSLKNRGDMQGDEGR